MFEAYSVGIRLKLLDGVTAPVVAMAGLFQRLNRDVSTTRGGLGDIEKQLGRIKLLGLAGGAAAGVGAFGLSLFKGPLEEAKQFQTEVARFTSLGFGDKVTAEAVKFANGMKTFGTSARDNMTLVSDAMAVFKDLHHAEMAAPIMARMKFANEAVFGHAGKANESKFMDMLKVIEFRGGLSSSSEFESQANYVQKVISGSRGRVDATQLLQALKTGGVALSGRSNSAFYLGGEPLIQEFGGSRYGTAAMSIYQNLVQSRGTITAQQELYRLGLLDPSKVEFNQLGQLKKALPGSFKGSSILEKQGELALLEQVLLPAFASKGITGEEGIIRELGMILGNRTGSGLMSRIYQQRETLKMQSAANVNAQDINGLDATARGTLAGREIELHAKWRDVLKELGTAVLPIAIKAVTGLTSVIQSAVSFAREFPLLTKGLTIGFGVLAGLVATGGVLALASAGFSGLGMALGMLGGGAGVLAGVSVGIGLITKAALGLAAVWGASKVFELGAALYDLHKAETREGVKLTAEAQARVATGGASGGWGQNPIPSPYISGRTTAGQPIQTTVNLDGRKMAEVLTVHQARAASKSQTGTNSFDGRMSPVPAGATGGW